MTTTLAKSGLGNPDSKDIKRLKLLMYGPFGTRKTVTAHHLPNTRTLDFDEGMQSVEWAVRSGILTRPGWEDLSMEERLNDIVFTTLRPPASLDENLNKVFDQAADQVEAWVAEEDIPPEEWEERCMSAHGVVYNQYWDTLIIDSGTSLTAAVIVKALQENDRLEVSKSWSKRKKKGLTPVMIQDRGALNILFQKFMTLCHGTGKNIVLICHEYTKTDKKGNTVAVEPSLSGALRQDVPKDFDEVWYCKIKGAKGNLRGVFQTYPGVLTRCRTRLGCLEEDEEMHFPSIRKKVAEFYGVPEERLWTRPKGTEEVQRYLDEEAENAVAV